MNSIRPKGPRLRLDPDLYDRLQGQVLTRDGWRCQYCGTGRNLEVHHQQFRSYGEKTQRKTSLLCAQSAIRERTAGAGDAR